MTIKEAVENVVTVDELRRVMDDEIIDYQGRKVSVGDALALHVLESYLHGVKLRTGAYHIHFDTDNKGIVLKQS